MEKISINLLPIELRTKSRADVKKNLIIKLSVGVLVFSIIISALVLSWSVIQSQTLKNASNEYEKIKAKVETQKEKEGLVVLLKKRIGQVSQITQKPTPQVQVFNLITSLIPPDVQVTNLTVAKSGDVKLNCFTTSSLAMKTLIDSLTDQAKTEGKFKDAKIGSFTQTTTGLTFDIEVNYAGAIDNTTKAKSAGTGKTQ